MTMNCNSVRDQLSAYMDGEALPELAVQIEQHLSGCESCAKELVQFKQLSIFARDQVESEGSPIAWEAIAAKLDASDGRLNGTTLAAESSMLDPRAQGLTPIRSQNWKKITGAIVALAATVLVVANLTIQKHDTHPTMNQVSVAAVNLQPVLELFQRDAYAALDAMDKQFTLKEIPLAEADADFGRLTYVSAAAKGDALPGDAVVASTKTFSFPFCQCPKGQCSCGPGGCQCVACVCERPDGTSYLVLEHCKSQAVSFGDLPVQLVKRDGQQFQQVTMDGTETISFDRPSGKITVVGLRGNDEIQTLLASL